MIARTHAALAGGVAAAILFAAVGSAHADWDRWDRWEDRQPVAQRAVHPDRERWQRRHPVAKRAVQAKKAPRALQMPLIAISIANQRLTLYDRGEVVAQAPVSTGMPGHPTPMGVFSVIQKQIFHESNIYSGAPMPYMQRITWSGVAMHAGALPGYPASHGCIRMPYDFAVKLYGLTRAGARVIITRDEIAPVAFEHPGLFQLPKPAMDNVTQLIGPAAPQAPEAIPASAVRTAQRRTAMMMSDADDAQPPAAIALPKPAEASVAEPPQNAELPAAPAADTSKPVQEAAKDAIWNIAKDAVAPSHPAWTEPRELEAGPEDPGATAEEPAALPQDAAQDGVREAAQLGAQDGAQVGAQVGAQIGVHVGGEIAAPSFEPATGTVMVKPIVVTPAHPIEVPKTFTSTSAPAKAETALAPAPAPAATPAVETSLVPYGPEQPLRPGPITVFVSKKEGKVFVRKGFQPVLSAPVTIARPNLPLGTHVFTASEPMPDGVSFRWLELSLSDPSPQKVELLREPRTYRSRHAEKTAAPAPSRTASAAEALDRVEIPAPALARISALMSQGATLIISDQGLGPETGTETDFIVLTR